MVLGFNDTFGIAVRKEIADQYGLKTYSDLTVLRDDKHIYPSYQCGLVIRQDTMKKYPELGETLQKFSQI